MKIKLSSVEDAPNISQYYIDNALHFSIWEPIKDDGYDKIESWEERLKEREIEQNIKIGAYFLAYQKDSKEIIATCNLTGITYGAFLACYMGYSISSAFEGQGKMKKLCTHATQYAFQELGLHRIMANYMPNNKRSESLLSRMGFNKEGFAEKYLKINGKWEDHVLTSLINNEST